MEWCAAARMWRQACAALAPADVEPLWERVVKHSPPDHLWHSLWNCVAYQAGVWQNLLAKGVADVSQGAAFKLAIVLRHTPPAIAARLLHDLLRNKPQQVQQDLTSYILTLLTDDEASYCGKCGAGDSPPSPSSRSPSPGPPSPPPPAPLRDLRLFGDCELAVLAASREEYDAHAKLVRAEYSALSHNSYVELRVKVLHQLLQIPQLYHTAEFSCLEAAARANIDREISTLRDHLPPSLAPLLPPPPPPPAPSPPPASPDSRTSAPDSTVPTSPPLPVLHPVTCLAPANSPPCEPDSTN